MKNRKILLMGCALIAVVVIYIITARSTNVNLPANYFDSGRRRNTNNRTSCSKV